MTRARCAVWRSAQSCCTELPQSNIFLAKRGRSGRPTARAHGRIALYYLTVLIERLLQILVTVWQPVALGSFKIKYICFRLSRSQLSFGLQNVSRHLFTPFSFSFSFHRNLKRSSEKGPPFCFLGRLFTCYSRCFCAHRSRSLHYSWGLLPPWISRAQVLD